MSTLRYKFGPSIIGLLARPLVAGELPDVDVTARIAGVRANDPGKVDLDIAFTVPAYDPTKSNPLVEVHAIAFPANAGIPTDPELALAAAQPKASADASGHTAGGDLVVIVVGAPIGQSTILTVLGILDAPTPSPVS